MTKAEAERRLIKMIVEEFVADVMAKLDLLEIIDPPPLTTPWRCVRGNGRIWIEMTITDNRTLKGAAAPPPTRP